MHRKEGSRGYLVSILPLRHENCAGNESRSPGIVLRSLCLRFLLVVLLLACSGNLSLLSPDAALADSLSPADALVAQKHMDDGVSSFQRGDFEQAALSLAEAAKLYETGKNFRQQSNALTHLAEAYQAVGLYKEALKNLESALVLSRKAGDGAQTAMVLGALGNLHVATGPPDIAFKYLNEALSKRFM